MGEQKLIKKLKQKNGKLGRRIFELKTRNKELAMMMTTWRVTVAAILCSETMARMT